MEFLLIISVLLLISFLLFYSLRAWAKEVTKKRSHLHLGRTYEKFVLKKRLIIDQAEIINNRVIAIDKSNKLLLAINHAGKTKQEHCIPLLSIASTKVEEHKNKEGNIAKIVLSLQHDGGKVYKIEFFNHGKDHLSELTSLNRKAVCWKQKIDVHKRSGRIKPEQEFVL